MRSQFNIEAVHVGHRLALTDNGICLHIAHLYDENGVETQDNQKAVYGTCQCSEGWITIDFSAFEDTYLN